MQDTKNWLFLVSPPKQWLHPLNPVSVKPQIGPPLLYQVSIVFPHPTHPPSSNYNQSQKTALSIKQSTVTFAALSLTSLSVSVTADFRPGCQSRAGLFCMRLAMFCLSASACECGTSTTKSEAMHIPCTNFCVRLCQIVKNWYGPGTTFCTDKATPNLPVPLLIVSWQRHGWINMRKSGF